MGPLERLRALLVGFTIAIASVPGFAGVAAAAERCEAPPGTSGIEQYCETLPGAKGGSGAGTEPPVGPSLQRTTIRRLERAGRDGGGVLALPASGRRANERVEAPSQPSESPLGAVGSAIESGPSTGSGFLWVLIAAGCAIGGIAWIRYRGESET